MPMVPIGTRGKGLREVLKKYPHIHLEHLPAYHPELNQDGLKLLHMR